MLYQKELQIKYEVDVFVAGGGAAGIAAAVAAARQGKSVFLAEATGCFGGLGTSGLVPAFAPFDDGKQIVSAGIGLEIRKSVSQSQPLDSYWTMIDAEELKLAYDSMVQNAGVQFSFFTTVLDVATDNGRISHVILNAKSGIFAAKAKVYIDCTGDGDLCAMAGAPFEKGDENGQIMPATLCSLWANVSDDHTNEVQDSYIEQAYKDGVFTYCDRHLPGMFLRDSGIGGGNLGHLFGMDPLDETSVTKGMLWGRLSMKEYEAYYKKYLKGFQNIRLCATAAIPGVRESRRIVCDYMLNIDDFVQRAVFDDEIGRYCYPIDIHVNDTSEEEYKRFSEEYENLRYAAGESYGIPYRSLIPVSLSNVLVAGRCMGTDKKMQASIRVMPGCFITGQAAGTAAAIAVDSGDVRTVSIQELQKKLKENGAYLPNCQ